MSDEIKDQAATTQPSESTPDGSLEDAWAEVLGSEGDDKQAEAPVVAAPPAQDAQPSKDAAPAATGDEDQADRSRLGRKVKEQAEQIGVLTNAVQALLSRVAPQHDDQELSEPEYVTTPADIDRLLAVRQAKATKAQQEYSSGYQAMLGHIGKAHDSQDDHGAVVALMMQSVRDGSNTYNRRYSGNPAQDAITNYAAAEAAYYRSKAMGATPTFGRQETASGTAVAPGSSKATPSKTMPKLDDETAALVKDMKKQGFSDDELAKILRA